MKGCVLGILLILSAPACAQDSVTVREMSKDSFVATLLSEKQLSIEDAQHLLLAAATTTCKSSFPRLEHYDFKAKKNISSQSATSELFEFNQRFTCTQDAEAPVSQSAPTSVSDVEKERLIGIVTTGTRDFLGSSNNDMLRAFRSKFSQQLDQMLPVREWMEEQALLHKSSGSIQANPLFKVTTYVDPPNSPKPGIYLAVDFQVSYDQAPFRCGYVMWLYDQQANLSVLRIEDGILYSKDAASMTQEQLAQTRAQFRCFAP